MSSYISGSFGVKHVVFGKISLYFTTKTPLKSTQLITFLYTVPALVELNKKLTINQYITVEKINIKTIYHDLLTHYSSIIRF